MTTNIRVWAWTGIATLVLVAGILFGGGAISFAQEGSTTPTPIPTQSDDGSTATPAPSDDADSDGDTDKSGDHNCPDRETEDSATESSTTTSGA